MAFKQIVISLALFLILTAGAVTVTAAPIERCHIPAARHDPIYEFENAVNVFLSVLSEFHGDRNHCYVDKRLPIEERNRLRKDVTHHLSIENGADQYLLEDPTLFQDVVLVGLRSENYSETYLRALVLFHPKLESLTICQTDALSDEALRDLKKFGKLNYLELDCPLAHPQLLKETLPLSLKELHISDSWELPELAKLEELRIQSCRLDVGFFDALHAPHLRELYLHNMDVPPGSLKSISKFKLLRELSMYLCNVDESELHNLRPLPYLETSIAMDHSFWQSFYDRAEKSYRSNDFRKALKEYDSVAFSQPSVYLYLQRARCYIRLGNPQSALENCDYACAMDPNSPEIQIVRSEAKRLAK